MLYCRSHFFLVWCLIPQVWHLDTVVAVSEEPPAGCPFRCENSHTQLSCANRKLYTFPDVSGCRQQIEELDVSYNQISALPSDALTGFTALETMDLSHNVIKSIPTGLFRDLEQLRELYLQSNNLSVLQPGVFEGLERLNDRLMLRCNRLTQIKRHVFGDLASIRILALDENSIETIEAKSFNGMHELGYLYLKDNRIVRLDRGVFSGLGKLSRLDLRNNRIQVIDPGAFEGLSELTELKLSSNRITTVSSIVGLPDLSNLNIRDNQIKTFDNQFLLDKLHGNLHISIGENPLDCTCKMETLRSWYRQHEESTDGARCATPVEYLDITLASISKPLPSCLAPFSNSEKSTFDRTEGSTLNTSLIVVIPVIGLLILAICVYCAIRWHTTRKQPVTKKPPNNNIVEQHDEHRVQVQPDGYEPDGYHTFLPQNEEHNTARPAVEPRPPSLSGHTFSLSTEDGSSDISSVAPEYLSFTDINGLESDEDIQAPLSSRRPMLPLSHTRFSTPRPAVPPRFFSGP